MLRANSVSLTRWTQRDQQHRRFQHILCLSIKVTPLSNPHRHRLSLYPDWSPGLQPSLPRPSPEWHTCHASEGALQHAAATATLPCLETLQDQTAVYLSSPIFCHLPSYSRFSLSTECTSSYSNAPVHSPWRTSPAGAPLPSSSTSSVSEVLTSLITVPIKLVS